VKSLVLELGRTERYRSAISRMGTTGGIVQLQKKKADRNNFKAWSEPEIIYLTVMPVLASRKFDWRYQIKSLIKPWDFVLYSETKHFLRKNPHFVKNDDDFPTELQKSVTKTRSSHQLKINSLNHPPRSR